ncbi:MAG: hypothetical protein Rhims3KO_14460 [Hyphomicrobiales bacterium]
MADQQKIWLESGNPGVDLIEWHWAKFRIDKQDIMTVINQWPTDA